MRSDQIRSDEEGSNLILTWSDLIWINNYENVWKILEILEKFTEFSKNFHKIFDIFINITLDQVRSGQIRSRSGQILPHWTWSDLISLDLIWSDLIWPDLTWSWLDMIWSHEIWSDPDLIWSDLFGAHLIWSDLRSDQIRSNNVRLHLMSEQH